MSVAAPNALAPTAAGGSPARLIARPGSTWLGVLAAIAAVGLTTAVIYPLQTVAPAVSTGVLYLIGVLLISTFWGRWLGLATALGSALAFNFFHIAPTGRFTIADLQNWMALAVYLASAVIASSVADLARGRALEAERRRQEADLAADLARTLLSGTDLDTALPRASAQLAAGLGLEVAELRVGADGATAGRTVLPLDLGRGRAGALAVPASLDAPGVGRIAERVVPAVEALLGAALDRDELQTEVVETRALRRSDELKTALLRTVSHDLRSPLTAILTAGHAVRSPTLPPEDRDELGGVVIAEATRLSRLVENLLDLSRLQAGAAPPRSDWCSIEDVVRTAVEHLADQHGPIAAKLQFDRDLPLVRADAAQLERVFVNLIENAVRYGAGEPIHVRARAGGGRLRVRVVDHGPGVDPRWRERIFEPFFRADPADDHDGSGLGLAIARGFVEANGGRVTVDSLPGQGTAFVLEFPLAREPA